MKRLLAIILLLTAGTAFAQGRAPFDVPGYSAAIEALRLRLADAKTGGALPDVRQDVVATALAQIDAATNAIDSPVLPVTGLETFQSICIPEQVVFLDYIDAALKADMAAAPTAAARALLQARGPDGLSLRHYPVLMPMIALATKCNLSHLDVLRAALADTPRDTANARRIEGLRMIRDGIFDQMTGAIKLSTLQSIGEPRRRTLIDPMAHYARQASEAFTPAQRTKLIALLRTMPPSLWSPAVRQSARTLLAALERQKDCTGLCTL